VAERLELLRFRLTKRFGVKTVLDDFALEVRGREFITILGPSGCGKSTALNLLAGLLEPTTAEIWLDGVRIDRLPSERRGFGMVFQNYALFPHLTVFDNVAFGITLRRRPRSEIVERARRVLDLVQLAGLEDRYPAQLSGGQQQRVAIARALVVEPRLLLLDEPLSNLDAKLRLEMRHEIRRIHRAVHRATIYVTHDQDEALSLADRIVVLQDGRVQQIGTPEDLYARPANLAVARFMGYRNIFHIGVERVEGNRASLLGGNVRLEGTTQVPISGNRAMVAVRPEEITLGASAGNTLSGTVDQVEYCGRDFLVDVVTPVGTLYLRTERRVCPDEAVQLSILPERVLVFSPDTAREEPTA
jgi:putative spermidine/putrescine transport system ATP-binding protein